MYSKILTLFVVLLIGSSLYANSDQEEFKIGYNTYGNPSSYLYPISISQWHYIAWSKGSDNVGRLYIDGQLVIEETYTHNTWIWNKLYLGTSLYTKFNDFYKGWLDEIRISNTVRTKEEIVNYYNSKTTFTTDANTISLWHFDETNGNTFSNSIGGTNAGKLNGNASFSSGKFGNSIYFDGNNSYADCNFNMPESNVTIEFWMKTDGFYKNNEGRGGTVIQPYGLYSGNIFLVTSTSNTESECNLSGSLENGLVAYFPFCGNANDESGNGNNGTVNGATLTTDRFGNEKSAYSFDGTTNKIVVPYNNSQTFDEQFTISCWLNSELNNESQSIFLRQGSTNKTWVLLMPSNKLRVYTENSYYIETSGIDGYSTWYQLVVTIDNNLVNVFKNKQLIYSGIIDFPFDYSQNDMILGYAGSGNQPYPYKGKLDDIGIWNRILTEQEIKDLYHDNGYDRNCTNLNGSLTNGLVANYPFCGNAIDESGNGLDGTVNGATLTSDRFGNDNSAYSFTTNQEIVIPNTEDQNLFPLTISLWYSIDSINTGDNSNIFSKYNPAEWNGYLIHTINGDSGLVTTPWYIRDNSNKVLGLYGEEPFYQSNVKENNWYHFIYTVDDTGGKIYVDGKLIDSDNWTGNAGKCSNVDLWKIGGKYDHWFNGKIDDIAIWNRALSEDEITQLYYTCKFNTTIYPVINLADKDSDIIFWVTSNGDDLTYQWQTNPSNIGWINVPDNTTYSGSASNELTVSDIQLSNHLQPFRVVASSETCSEVSNTAYISLNDTCVNVIDEVNYISVTDTLIIVIDLSGISSTPTNTIKVYPNPTKDYITINYGNYESLTGYKININNSIGQVVYSSPITEQYSTINLSELGGIGLYFVNILNQQNNIIDSRKLMLK